MSYYNDEEEAPEWFYDLPLYLQELLKRIGVANKEWGTTPPYVPEWGRKGYLVGSIGWAAPWAFIPGMPRTLTGLAPLYAYSGFVRAVRAGYFGEEVTRMLGAEAWTYTGREEEMMRRYQYHKQRLEEYGPTALMMGWGEYRLRQMALYQARGAYWRMQQAWSPIAIGWSAARIATYATPKMGPLRAFGFAYYGGMQRMAAAGAMMPYIKTALQIKPPSQVSPTRDIIEHSMSYWMFQYPTLREQLISGMGEWTLAQTVFWGTKATLYPPRAFTRQVMYLPPEMLQEWDVTEGWSVFTGRAPFLPRGFGRGGSIKYAFTGGTGGRLTISEASRLGLNKGLRGAGFTGGEAALAEGFIASESYYPARVGAKWIIGRGMKPELYAPGEVTWPYIRYGREVSKEAVTGVAGRFSEKALGARELYALFREGGGRGEAIRKTAGYLWRMRFKPTLIETLPWGLMQYATSGIVEELSTMAVRYHAGLPLIPEDEEARREMLLRWLSYGGSVATAVALSRKFGVSLWGTGASAALGWYGIELQAAITGMQMAYHFQAPYREARGIAPSEFFLPREAPWYQQVIAPFAAMGYGWERVESGELNILGQNIYEVESEFREGKRWGRWAIRRANELGAVINEYNRLRLQPSMRVWRAAEEGETYFGTSLTEILTRAGAVKGQILPYKTIEPLLYEARHRWVDRLVRQYPELFDRSTLLGLIYGTQPAFYTSPITPEGREIIARRLTRGEDISEMGYYLGLEFNRLLYQRRAYWDVASQLYHQHRGEYEGAWAGYYALRSRLGEAESRGERNAIWRAINYQIWLAQRRKGEAYILTSYPSLSNPLAFIKDYSYEKVRVGDFMSFKPMTPTELELRTQIESGALKIAGGMSFYPTTYEEYLTKQKEVEEALKSVEYFKKWVHVIHPGEETDLDKYLLSQGNITLYSSPFHKVWLEKRVRTVREGRPDEAKIVYWSRRRTTHWGRKIGVIWRDPRTKKSWGWYKGRGGTFSYWGPGFTFGIRPDGTRVIRRYDEETGQWIEYTYRPGEGGYRYERQPIEHPWTIHGVAGGEMEFTSMEQALYYARKKGVEGWIEYPGGQVFRLDFGDTKEVETGEAQTVWMENTDETAHGSTPRRIRQASGRLVYVY